MNVFRFLTAAFFVVSLTFCKQGPDPALQEALKIQDEAIHMGMDINSTINEMIISDTTKQSHNALGQLLVRLKKWEKEMIPVPGVQHDHDHGHNNSADTTGKDTTGVAKDKGHDHDQDHHGHVHATGDEIAAQLTPEENKQAQIEWKNRLMEIKTELEKVQKSIGK